MFKRKGTYVYLWLIHVDIWQKSNHYIKHKKNRFCPFYTILTHSCDRDSCSYFIGEATMV